MPGAVSSGRIRERIENDRPGSEEAVAKMHAGLAGLRRVSPPGHLQAVGQRSRLASAVKWRAGSASSAGSVEEALNRGLRRSSRCVAVAHSVMCKAAQSQVGRLRATALGDRHQVVDLQQMGRGAAPPGERVAITAASAVAMPDVAPDSRGNVAPPRRLAAAVNRFAARVRRCSGCCVGRSAVGEPAEHRLRRRSDDRRAPYACPRREATRRRAVRCSGRRAARSAVRAHPNRPLRRRSGDRRARYTSARIGAIQQGAGRELRRRSSGGRAQWNATFTGAIQERGGR